MIRSTLVAIIQNFITYRRRRDFPLRRVPQTRKNKLKVIKKVVYIFRLFIPSRRCCRHRTLSTELLPTTSPSSSSTFASLPSWRYRLPRARHHPHKTKNQIKHRSFFAASSFTSSSPTTSGNLPSLAPSSSTRAAPAVRTLTDFLGPVKHPSHRRLSWRSRASSARPSFCCHVNPLEGSHLAELRGPRQTPIPASGG